MSALVGKILGLIGVLNRGNIHELFPRLGASVLFTIAGSCFVVKSEK